MFRTLTITNAMLAATMAHADSHGPAGDAEAGEAAFRACISCHVVADADGNVLAGRNGRTGPNLYGIAGRAMGSVEGFRYGPGMAEAAEMGEVWNEELFTAYVPNATNFLRELTGNSRVRSAMSPQRADAEDLANLWAFLVSLAPEAAAEGEAEAEAEASE